MSPPRIKHPLSTDYTNECQLEDEVSPIGSLEAPSATAVVSTVEETTAAVSTVEETTLPSELKEREVSAESENK